MSSYMYFALKNKGVVAPLHCVTRSSELYQATKDFVSYGKFEPMNGKTLELIHDELIGRIETSNNFIRDQEKYLEYIKDVTMTTEEREEAWYEINNYIREARDEIKYKEYALDFIETLLVIYHEAESINEWYRDEYKIDPDNYIYCGIECGFFGEDEEE